MDVEFLCLLIEVVETGTARGQNVVRLKAYDIVEESAELVDLALDLNVGPRVLLEKAIVLQYLVLKLSKLGSKVLNHLLLLQNFQKLALAKVLSH